MIYLKDASGPGFTPVSTSNPIPVSLTGTQTVTAMTVSGKITFATGSTSAIGLQFGTDTNLYRRSAGLLNIDCPASGDSGFVFRQNGTDRWALTANNTGTAFVLFNYATAAAAITVGAGSSATFAGAIITTPQALSGAGAVDVVTTTTDYTSTGGAQALTLANGTSGQLKIIKHVVDGGSGVLTPTTASGFTTITFTNAGETATLQYGPAGWCIVALNGAVAA